MEVVILVQLENGDVHQVVATKEQKELALNMCLSEKGALQLHEDKLEIDFKTSES